VTCEGMAVAACITVRDQVLPTYLEAPSRTIDDVAIAPGVNGRLGRVRTCLNFQPICHEAGRQTRSARRRQNTCGGLHLLRFACLRSMAIQSTRPACPRWACVNGVVDRWHSRRVGWVGGTARFAARPRQQTQRPQKLLANQPYLANGVNVRDSEDTHKTATMADLDETELKKLTVGTPHSPHCYREHAVTRTRPRVVLPLR
jgi:hypothetical protein